MFPDKNTSVSALNGYGNAMVFFTTCNMNPHDKTCSENEQNVIDREQCIIEKKDKKSYFVDALVVPEKI